MGINRFRYNGKEVILHGHEDHINRVISRYNTFYEIPMLRYIEQNIRGGEFVDVGANIGNHSVFFAMFCGANVHAFEPAPANIGKLLANRSVNKLKDKIKIYPNLLSDHNNFKYDLINKDPDNMGMVKAVESFKSGRHVSGTIDLYFRDRIIHLLKIDVEGMEMEVLEGARLTIENCHPHVFVEGDIGPLEEFFDDFDYMYLQEFNHTPTHYFMPV